MKPVIVWVLLVDKRHACAAPSRLGLMRQYLPEELNKIMKRELAKNLVRIPTNDLPSHVKGILHL